MIATLATLVVRIQGDITSLVESAKKTEGILDKLDKGVNGIGASFKRAGEIAGGFLAANVIAGAGEKIMGFVGDSLKAASDLQQSVGGVEAIFGESSKTILDWGNSAAKQAGLSRNAFNELAVPLGAMLKNAGLEMTTVTGKTIDLTQRAADMAATFGGTTKDALDAITAGLRGEADPLERYGIGLSAAKIEAAALAMTGKTVASSLTDQEKMLARVQLVMDQSTDAAGKFAKELDTDAGKAALASAKYENLQAMLGSKMLPVQTMLTEAKIRFIDFVVTKVIPTLEELYAKHWPAIAKAVETYIAIARKEWEMLWPVIKLVIDDIILKVNALIDGWKAMYEVVASVVGLVKAVFRGDWATAWQEMKDIALGMGDVLKAQLTILFGSLPGLVVDMAKELARAGYNAGRDLADSIVNGIGNLAGRVADKLSIAGVSLGDVIDAGGGAFDRIGLRAAGGPVTAGMPYIVGERRPELFVPSQNGYVYPSVRAAGGEAHLHVHVENHGTIVGIDDAVAWVNAALAEGRRRGMGYGLT